MLWPDFAALQPDTRLRALCVGKYLHGGMEERREKLHQVTRYRIVGDDRDAADIRPLVGRIGMDRSCVSARAERGEFGEEPYVVFAGTRIAFANRHLGADIVI